MEVFISDDSSKRKDRCQDENGREEIHAMPRASQIGEVF